LSLDYLEKIMNILVPVMTIWENQVILDYHVLDNKIVHQTLNVDVFPKVKKNVIRLACGLNKKSMFNK